MPNELEFTDPPADTVQPGDSVVGADELVMRRVLNQPKLYDPRRPDLVREGAFLPNKKDDTGISLSRRQSATKPHFFTPEVFKANCSDPRHRLTAGVAELLVSDILGIGLSVQADPSPADPERGLISDQGHSLVPEINALDWSDESLDGKRQYMRLWAAQLVKLARGRLVITPGDPSA